MTSLSGSKDLEGLYGVGVVRVWTVVEPTGLGRTIYRAKSGGFGAGGLSSEEATFNLIRYKKSLADAKP